MHERGDFLADTSIKDRYHAIRLDLERVGVVKPLAYPIMEEFGDAMQDIRLFIIGASFFGKSKMKEHNMTATVGWQPVAPIRTQDSVNIP
ncbi:hypothetical protein [Paenibacillus sp. BK720]|nr:hypothetical protein [Paenibacillus sp. BK720]NIK66996.1 hypothetical protein [Paenibacillus sp. BK720]